MKKRLAHTRGRRQNACLGKFLQITGVAAFIITPATRTASSENGWFYDGSTSGFNFYIYANNNPVNGNDPSGQFVIYIGYTGSATGGPLSALFGKGIVFDNSGNVSGYKVYGAGGGFSAGGSGTFGLSFGFLANFGQNGPATTTSDFAGPFANASLGAGFGAHGSVDAFIDPYNTNNMGGGLTLGPGVGGGFSLTATNTVLTPSPFSQSNNNISSVSQSISNDYSAAIAAANGGFVLYPNKSNTNMMKSVYSKK